MRIIWSFLVSGPIFFGAHLLFRHFGVWEPCVANHIANAGTCLPSAKEIAGNAASTPGWFLASLYLSGVALGYTTGHVWRTRALDRVLLLLRLDIRRNRPALSQVLGQRSYIDVKLLDDTLFRGNPRVISEPDETVQLLYLTEASRKVDDGWEDEEHDVAILLDRVKRIYILDAERPLFPSGSEPAAGYFARLRAAVEAAAG